MFSKPKHLSEIGGEAFDRIQEELELKGVEGVGFDVIERYAVAYALWFETQAKVRHEGLTWGDGSRNGRMIDLHKLNSSVAALRREMGLGSTIEQDDDEATGGDGGGGDGDAGESGGPRTGIVYKFEASG